MCNLYFHKNKHSYLSAKGDDLERRCEVVNRELRVLSQMSGK